MLWFAALSGRQVVFLVRNPFEAVVAERKRFVSRQLQLRQESKKAGGMTRAQHVPIVPSTTSHTSTPPWHDFVGEVPGYAGPCMS